MTDRKLQQRLGAWHHGRFDDSVAPDRLRGAVLAIPEAGAEPRGPVAEPTRLSRPLILLVAAALAISVIGGAMALGRQTWMPDADPVPVDFATLNPCEVLGFGPTIGGERYRGSLELSDRLEHTARITSREFAAIRSGEALPQVAPRGSCGYHGDDTALTIEFRAQETTHAEALEIVRDPRYALVPQTPSEVAPIGRATAWQACRAALPDGFDCNILFVSAEPYFFVITDRSLADSDVDAMRQVAARVLEVLAGAR